MIFLGYRMVMGTLCLGLVCTGCDFTEGGVGFGGVAVEDTPEDGSSVDGTPTATPVPPRTNINPLSLADVSFEGELADDRAGAAVAFVGDMNGDGYGDLAIGAPGNDDRQPEAGKVYLFFGSDAGLDGGSLADADASYQGEGRDDGAGTTVVGAGDINGDGLDDLLIGAPRNDFGGVDAGRIYVVLGKTAGWYPGTRLANADFTLYGAEGDMVGDIGTVAGGRDLNGDGLDDIAIGAPFNSETQPEAGKVYIIAGRASGWQEDGPLAGSGVELLGSNADDWVGFSVAMTGDINGDVYDDLLIGAPHDAENGVGAGRAYVFLGKGSLSVVQADISVSELSFLGGAEGEELGSCVAAAGDVNGDGLGDFVVGAWGTSSGSTTGRYYLLFGDRAYKAGAPLYQVDDYAVELAGGGKFDYAGRPAASAGDMNGDGLSEVVLGNFLADQVSTDDDSPYVVSLGADAGVATLFLGRLEGWEALTGLSNADHHFLGESSGDSAGYALAGAGDINGDGLTELMIGAYRHGLYDVGQVYIYYGDTPFEPGYSGQ